MMFNATGGNFVAPTALLFDSCSGDWHLPHPADYDSACSSTARHFWANLRPARHFRLGRLHLLELVSAA